MGQSLQILVGPRGPSLQRGFGPDAPESLGDFRNWALQLLHGLGKVKLGLGPPRPGREVVEKSLCLAFHLGPTFRRCQGVDLDQHRLGLRHRVLRHAGRPGERAFGIASAQPAAGSVVGVIGTEGRVAGPQILEEISCSLPGIQIHVRQGQEKAGLVAFGRVLGHRGQPACQVLRGGRKVASAERVRCDPGRSRREEYL